MKLPTPKSSSRPLPKMEQYYGLLIGPSISYTSHAIEL